MTFRHRAGVSPYTSAFAFAETCVFDKQSPGPFHCGLLAQAPLLPKLRGQYAEFLNNPSPDGLRILSSSTCVGLRYGRTITFIYLFSPPASTTSLLLFQSLSPGATNARDGVHIRVSIFKFVRQRNLYRLCIDYAFRPRLSSRLTQGGRTYPWKPQIFGHYDSHAILATHSGILTSVQSTRPSDRASPRTQRSPTISIGYPKFRLYA